MVRPLSPTLCWCSVSRVFKATVTRIRGKSKQTLRSPRIELGTSCSESRALSNSATPAPFGIYNGRVGHEHHCTLTCCVLPSPCLLCRRNLRVFLGIVLAEKLFNQLVQERRKPEALFFSKEAITIRSRAFMTPQT